MAAKPLRNALVCENHICPLLLKGLLLLYLLWGLLLLLKQPTLRWCITAFIGEMSVNFTVVAPSTIGCTPGNITPIGLLRRVALRAIPLVMAHTITPVAFTPWDQIRIRGRGRLITIRTVIGLVSRYPTSEACECILLRRRVGITLLLKEPLSLGGSLLLWGSLLLSTRFSAVFGHVSSHTAVETSPWGSIPRVQWTLVEIVTIIRGLNVLTPRISHSVEIVRIILRLA